jgi:hypothetical protein
MTSRENQKGNPHADCLFGSRVGLIAVGSNGFRADLSALMCF